MESYQVITNCETYLIELIINEQITHLCEFLNLIHEIFNSENEKLHLDELMQISKKLIENYSDNRTAKILKQAVESTSPASSMRHLKVIVCLLQQIFGTMRHYEGNFDKKIIDAYLSVISDILCRVSFSSDLRLHVLSHLIWVLGPALKVPMSEGCVADPLLFHFISSLKQCNITTALSIPILSFVRQVVTLLANTIFCCSKVFPLDEIFHPEFPADNEEIKWIVWWGVGLGLLLKMNGSYRNEMSQMESEVLNRLMDLSADIECDCNKIPLPLKKEIVKFHQELKFIYAHWSDNRLNYQHESREIDTCLSSGCEFGVEEVQLLSGNDMNFEDEDNNVEKTDQETESATTAVSGFLQVSTVQGATPDKKPPTYREVEDIVRCFLNSNPNPLNVNMLKCLIDCACVDDII